MAHYRRRRARTQPSGRYSRKALRHRLGHEPRSFLRNYPRHWDKTYHTAPKRRIERDRLRKILLGADPDNMTWPDGRRPHIYYW